MEQLFFAADDISGLSVDERFDKLKAEVALPSGFTFPIVESVLFIHCMAASTRLHSVC